MKSRVRQYHISVLTAVFLWKKFLLGVSGTGRLWHRFLPESRPVNRKTMSKNWRKDRALIFSSPTANSWKNGRCFVFASSPTNAPYFFPKMYPGLSFGGTGLSINLHLDVNTKLAIAKCIKKCYCIKTKFPKMLKMVKVLRQEFAESGPQSTSPSKCALDSSIIRHAQNRTRNERVGLQDGSQHGVLYNSKCSEALTQWTSFHRGS